MDFVLFTQVGWVSCFIITTLMSVRVRQKIEYHSRVQQVPLNVKNDKLWLYGEFDARVISAPSK